MTPSTTVVGNVATSRGLGTWVGKPVAKIHCIQVCGLKTKNKKQPFSNLSKDEKKKKKLTQRPGALKGWGGVRTIFVFLGALAASD